MSTITQANYNKSQLKRNRDNFAYKQSLQPVAINTGASMKQRSINLTSSVRMMNLTKSESYTKHQRKQYIIKLKKSGIWDKMQKIKIAEQEMIKEQHAKNWKPFSTPVAHESTPVIVCHGLKAFDKSAMEQEALDSYEESLLTKELILYKNTVCKYNITNYKYKITLIKVIKFTSSYEGYKTALNDRCQDDSLSTLEQYVFMHNQTEAFMKAHEVDKFYDEVVEFTENYKIESIFNTVSNILSTLSEVLIDVYLYLDSYKIKQQQISNMK